MRYPILMASGMAISIAMTACGPAMAQTAAMPTPDQITAYVDAKPEPLRPLYRALYVGGERNAVLNFERLGLAAMQGGMYRESAWAFDEALNRIEAVFGDNPQAAAARSAFHNEANKDFKGEPYERAMAYYYRGLLYLRVGDYGNARASFKSAEYQDTLSDSETFQSDFAVMNYLIGWTQRCDGQGAASKESFDLAAKGEKALVAPAAGDNVLMIAELGYGPVKARDGKMAQKIVFQNGPTYAEDGATVMLVSSTPAPAPKMASVKGRSMRATPAAPVVSNSAIILSKASSVTYQATTRGGRAIDGLMNGKAAWKEGTSTAGNVAMLMGAQLMGQNSSLGLGGMGFGAAMSLFSSGMKTKADIRAWDGLPDLIMVGTTHTANPGWTYKVSYIKGSETLDVKGSEMRADAKGCSVVWMRARPAAYSDQIAGEDAGVAQSQSRKKPVMEKNRMFRSQLEGAKL